MVLISCPLLSADGIADKLRVPETAEKSSQPLSTVNIYAVFCAGIGSDSPYHQVFDSRHRLYTVCDRLSAYAGYCYLLSTSHKYNPKPKANAPSPISTGLACFSIAWEIAPIANKLLNTPNPSDILIVLPFLVCFSHFGYLFNHYFVCRWVFPTHMHWVCLEEQHIA